MHPEPGRSLSPLAGCRPIGVSFVTDIWPFQWRIALSWVSGFFIFQYMTLAIAAEQGLEAAGNFGLAATVAAGVSLLAGAPVSAKQAPWAALIAGRRFADLDRSFRLAVGAAGSLALVLSLAAMAVLAAVPFLAPGMAARLPDAGTLGALLMATVLNQWVFATATYLRAHGREPMLGASLAFAAILTAAAHPLARLGSLPLAGGYLMLTATCGCLWSALLWRRARRVWHA
jgi:hypothetical protein